MFLFHIGTLAEHFHYRRMSRPELGNIVMLNEAQSNSLVVETYKRLVEAEFNCRWCERVVSSLKNEENVRLKVKQDIASLRAQVYHFNEQVSETKEINKTSLDSAATAFEARDKAIYDLGALKLKLEMEKKLLEVEERSESEQKEIFESIFNTFIFCSFFSSLLLLDKAELERLRDKAVESHQPAIASMSDMLNQYNGEVVKLVHQSPKLEKVVTDFVNSVKVVGVNDRIKQGFQATMVLDKHVSKVPGYDEGAKDVLEAAIVAFDNFHISVLEKVSGLVNESLGVIKEKSKLPIVKDDLRIFLIFSF
ncbi:hypothetical protein Hanom_Chr12g01156621 [Helianthus anomalus]